MGFIRAVCAATAFTAPMCTHTYAPRFYGFRGECDAVNATGRGALDISLILSSLSFSLSLTFPTRIRTHAVVLRVHAYT